MRAIFPSAILMLTIPVLMAVGCSEKKLPQEIKIAVPPFYSSALIFIAKDKNFFVEEGINLKVDILPYGKDCLIKMNEGKYDLAVAYTTPIANGILEKREFSILTELHSSGINTKLLYRKDLVETENFRLRDVKVGLVKDTNAEFLLSIYMAVNSINEKSITKVYDELPNLEKMLRNGDIEAAVLWQPHVSRILKSSEGKISTIETPFYTDFSALAGNRNFIEKNHSQIYSVTKALVRAKDFLVKNKEESFSIVSKYLEDKSILDNQEVLKDYSIELGLSQMFLTMLQSEVNWTRRSLAIEKFSIENTNYFEPVFIKKFIPAQVSIK